MAVSFELNGKHQLVDVVDQDRFPGRPTALTNAIFAATGKRIRKLPIRPGDLG